MWANWAAGDCYAQFHENISRVPFLTTVSAMWWWWFARMMGGILIFAGCLVFALNVMKDHYFATIRSHRSKSMSGRHKWMSSKIEWSAFWMVIGVVVLFSMAVGVTLNCTGISTLAGNKHLAFTRCRCIRCPIRMSTLAQQAPPVGLAVCVSSQSGLTLMAYRESALVRILTTPSLEPYVTRFGDPESN